MFQKPSKGNMVEADTGQAVEAIRSREEPVFG